MTDKSPIEETAITKDRLKKDSVSAAQRETVTLSARIAELEAALRLIERLDGGGAISHVADSALSTESTKSTPAGLQSIMNPNSKCSNCNQYQEKLKLAIEAVELLSNAMPDRIYIFGVADEIRWSEYEPESGHFETVDFDDVLSSLKEGM